MEKEPQLSEAVVTALLSPDRGAAACQEEVSASMIRITCTIWQGACSAGIRRMCISETTRLRSG